MRYLIYQNPQHLEFVSDFSVLPPSILVENYGIQKFIVLQEPGIALVATQELLMYLLFNS